MRKVVFVALLSGLLGSALADDLLARASGGALSENSLGVKKLSQAEMAEVKGGYKIGSVNWYVYSDIEDYTNIRLFFYSEERPVEEGHYWHYVNNVPTVW